MEVSFTSDLLQLKQHILLSNSSKNNNNTMPLTSSNNNKTNEYSDKNMEVNNPVQSTKNTNEDVDVDKNLIASTTSSSWENNNSLYQLNNGSGNYLQGGTLLQHQAIYLPLQPQGYYAPLDSFGSLFKNMNQKVDMFSKNRCYPLEFLELSCDHF